eukprot:6828055-Prymnesium_polylepis.1
MVTETSDSAQKGNLHPFTTNNNAFTPHRPAVSCLMWRCGGFGERLAHHQDTAGGKKRLVQ